MNIYLYTSVKHLRQNNISISVLLFEYNMKQTLLNLI